MKVYIISKVFVLQAVFLSICFDVNCTQKISNILDVFHHTNIAGESSNNVKDVTNLEFGNLVLYFDSVPVINFVPDRGFQLASKDALAKDTVECKKESCKTFLLPFVQVKDEKIIKKANKFFGNGYSVKFEKVSTPVKGIKITLFYDPNLVIFDYKFFESIGNKNAIVFNFYNKGLIDILKNLDDNILKTVWEKDSFTSGDFFLRSKIEKEGSAIKKKIIVVDLGHGGSDSGAVNESGLLEKNVTFSIGQKLSGLLKKKGFDVYVTRDSDKYLFLDERTSFANNIENNIFNDYRNKILVSIHANSCGNKLANGLEVFFAENSLFFDSVFFYDFESIKIVDNFFSKKNRESLFLANCVNDRIYDNVVKSYSTYKNRGVKKSLSQLLLGSHMPSALIEVGFLSNDKDSEFIKAEKNMEIFATGICEGIVEYFNKKA